MNTPINNSIFNETGCIRRDQLLSYRDHKLTGHEKHEVEEHLVDCLLCSDALEGLAFVSSVTLDTVKQEVSKINSPVPAQSYRPLLAAATIAGIIIFSYFTYTQYRLINDERLAVQEVSETPVVNNVDAVESNQTDSDTLPSSSTINKESKAEQQHVLQLQSKIETASEKSNPEETVALNADNEVAFSNEGTSVMKYEIPVAAPKEVSATSTANKYSGNQNITYVDNVKVIDYGNYGVGNVRQADAPRAVAPKYENSKKQVEAAETEIKSGDAVNRKAEYLDLVADPVILFNNGRYESANAGFDKLLELNEADQNAAFYKGLSLYNMKQYNPALKLLVPLSNDSTSPFMEEAKFYAAQSHISNGEIRKGKKLLEEVSDQNGFYSGKARAVLKQIK